MSKSRLALYCLCGFLLVACSPKGASGPQIDMKTKVVQVRGAVPLKLGEVMFPASVPGEGITFRALRNRTNCQMPKASKSAKVVSITAYEGPNEYSGPLFFASKVKGIDLKPVRVLSQSAGIAHIIVTDTEQPVYLSLASHDSVLWRVHTAPGVQIDGVSVMSYEPSGLMVAGLPAHRIGFIDRSDGDEFKEHQSYSKRYNKCWKSPQRYTNAKAIGKKNTSTGYVYSRQDLERFKAREQSYKDWLFWQRQYIGHLNADMGAYRVEAALIGPAPAPGQQLQPTPPSTPVYVAKDGFEPFWGTRAAAYAQYPESSERWAPR